MKLNMFNNLKLKIKDIKRIKKVLENERFIDKNVMLRTEMMRESIMGYVNFLQKAETAHLTRAKEIREKINKIKEDIEVVLKLCL